MIRRKPLHIIHAGVASDAVAPVPRLTLTLQEAAAALGVGESLFRELVISGKVPTVHIGARHVVRVAALEAYLAAQEAREQQEIRRRQDAALQRRQWHTG